jgi:hypothetical protein
MHAEHVMCRSLPPIARLVAIDLTLIGAGYRPHHAQQFGRPLASRRQNMRQALSVSTTEVTTQARCG